MGKRKTYSLDTQPGVFQLRDALAGVFETAGKYNCNTQSWSGCYGHNGADDAVDLLAREVEGIPVKVIWSRYDEFHQLLWGPLCQQNHELTWIKMDI